MIVDSDCVKITRPPVHSSRLINLPIELFLSIWDFLPPYSRVSLILTCRQLYANWQHSAFSGIDQYTPGGRSELLYLLRRIRKDHKDNPFLCHSCLCFHSRTLQLASFPGSGNKKGLRPPCGFGFPCTDTMFALALIDIQDRLDDPRDRGFTHYSGGYKTDVFVTHRIQIEVGRLGLCMWTEYTFDSPETYVEMMRLSRHHILQA